MVFIGLKSLPIRLPAGEQFRRAATAVDDTARSISKTLARPLRAGTSTCLTLVEDFNAGEARNTMADKLRKSDDLPLHLGAFKPVDHVVVTLKDDATARETASALREAGFADDEVIVYAPDEIAARLRPLIPEASGASGFGSEIQAMRAYLKMADEGCGWVIVYAPKREAEERVAEVARRFGAPQARKYNLLTIEELV